MQTTVDVGDNCNLFLEGASITTQLKVVHYNIGFAEVMYSQFCLQVCSTGTPNT